MMNVRILTMERDRLRCERVWRTLSTDPMRPCRNDKRRFRV